MEGERMWKQTKRIKKRFSGVFFLSLKKTLQHIFVAMVWFSTDFGESLRILSFNVVILTTKDTSSPVLDFRNFSLMVQHRLGDGGLVVVPYSSHVGSAKISEQGVFCLRSVMSILKPFSSRLKSFDDSQTSRCVSYKHLFLWYTLRYTSTATPVLQCI